ncbi:MAG: PAS domain-containing sensor histidine kinase [Peptostreptococcaceae bacterium]|nr:PAS domain-containing sensor histidine kinase [Peptostreptococcaceae bacterium]
MTDYDFKYSVLKLIFDEIEECIVYEDRHGYKIYCNESYIKHFECGIQLTEEDKEQDILKRKEVIESNEEVEYIKKIIRPNGDIKYYKVTKIPITNGLENVVGVLSIIKDKSHKYELERLRDRFFSNIKHEFRTPLNMIFSSIQLLDYKCKICKIGNCKDCFINNLQLININSLRILKLSNNFIDLTNIQAGCMDLNFRNHDIVSFVESICDNINNYKKFNGISLIFDTSVEEHILRFDTDKIERVILNLISNAIKFNIPQGYVYVSLIVEEKYINISIKDTGIGINENKIDSIFESFSDVENRLTKVSEGSGVGLALSKALVEMHDGKISVNSKLGNGSEFIISLPNIINEREEVDISYYKVDRNSLEKIKMELSDIY